GREPRTRQAQLVVEARGTVRESAPILRATLHRREPAEVREKIRFTQAVCGFEKLVAPLDRSADGGRPIEQRRRNLLSRRWPAGANRAFARTFRGLQRGPVSAPQPALDVRDKRPCASERAIVTRLLEHGDRLGGKLEQLVGR